MSTIAILPVKSFGAAKQRLASALGAGSRQALAQAMFSDVLSSLRRAPGVDAVAVVTADPVAEAAALGEAGLVSVVGRAAGRHLNALAIGLDPRPVDTARRRRSIGSQQALGRRARSDAELDAILAGTLDRLGRRLREAHRTARTVVLRLRFDDFSRATRSHSLAEATAHTATLLEAARVLLRGALPLVHERGITLLGVSLAGLDDDRRAQLALPFDVRSGPAIDGALDAVQQRFGSRSVGRATQLRLRPALEIPRLDD